MAASGRELLAARKLRCRHRVAQRFRSAGLFAALATGPPTYYIVGGLLLASVALFYFLLFKSFSHADDKLMPRLMELEETGPQ